LGKTERIRILVRVNYGYYVVERILLRCTQEHVKHKLRDEVMKNIGYIGANNLKNKWLDLLERSRLGLLKTASSESPHNNNNNHPNESMYSYNKMGQYQY
jgi:hypothetical protein